MHRYDSRRMWTVVIVGALLFGIVATVLGWNEPIWDMF